MDSTVKSIQDRCDFWEGHILRLKNILATEELLPEHIEILEDLIQQTEGWINELKKSRTRAIILNRYNELKNQADPDK